MHVYVLCVAGATQVVAADFAPDATPTATPAPTEPIATATPQPMPTSTPPPTATNTPSPTAASTPSVGRIAYTDQSGNIWLINNNGSNATRLTSDGSNSNLAWSPDGTKIAFISGKGNDARLQVISPDGRGRREFTNTGEVSATPSWSPDGTKILFEAS